ncbi:MAG: hypothetical protein KGZ83_02350 [Sulfuricella sp.]|nr:hypothetical protein [Sulfuricella sp.]
MNDTALTALDDGLQAFRRGFTPTPEWRTPHPMGDMLAVLRSRHPGGMRPLDREGIRDTVNVYLLTGVVLHRDDVFDLCLGAGWLDAEGMGILADRELRAQLLTLAETLSGRTKRLKAFRNLLYAYWSFPLHDDATPHAAIEGWRKLRRWLKERHAAFARHPARKPTWFNILAPHLHLLDERPCAPYAEALLRGDLEQLQLAIESLRIPTNSWLKTEAVMAQIDAAAQWPDAAFREHLGQLLKMATGKAAIEVPDGVAQRAIAGLVVRYARQENYEPHAELFTLALSKIGNPWRQRAAWDALACDADGSPNSLAREMVSDWLKERLIGTFFAGSGQDPASAELWQRYSVFMQEISLASPWLEAQGRALLLRMGDLLVIVPNNRDHPIEAYPWQTFFADGGTRLLDKETVAGSEIQTILAKHPPTLRARQTFEETRKFFEFAISAKARLLAASHR